MKEKWGASRKIGAWNETWVQEWDIARKRSLGGWTNKKGSELPQGHVEKRHNGRVAFQANNVKG